MATARGIQLSTADAGVFSSGAREDSARAASQVLQEDMEKHHVFFNAEGFHNHIVHHVLTLFSLGAAPEEILQAYRYNSSYQKPAMAVNETVVRELHDKAHFKEYLGKGRNYSNFLAFFQEEIEKKGVGNVLNDYVFAGDENAESMLARLFGGLLHPIIHLGFGIEFNQPAIVAQALAQTAVHDDSLGASFLLPAEKAAGGVGNPGQKTMLQILEDIRADKKLAGSVLWSDGNKIRDGVLKRAPEEMIRHAAEFTVSADQMSEKVAEAINNTVYFASTSQRPPKQVKFDFFLIHTVNSSIFFSKIITLPFLEPRTKLRLLEWKGRMDLLMYVSRGTPNLLLDEVTRYKTSHDWKTVFAHCNAHPGDDGHLSKLARAVAHGEEACRGYEDHAMEHGLKITGDMWLKIGNMAMDSTSYSDNTLWVRSAGFEEAWDGIGERAPNKL